jgi:hypothetical protein
MFIGIGLGLTRIGGGAPGAGGATVYIEDNFTGVASDVATRIPDTTGGPAQWVEWSGLAPPVEGDRKFEVSGSGTAISNSTPGQGQHVDIECGVSDCRVRAKFSTMGDLRIVVRATDGFNKWVLELFPSGSQYYVYKYEAGAATVLDSVTSVAMNDNDEFEVICSGNTISVTRNDVDEGLSVTDSFQASSTVHGWSLSSGTGAVEWFKVLPL